MPADSALVSVHKSGLMFPPGGARHHQLLFAAVKAFQVADNVAAGRRQQPGLKPDALKSLWLLTHLFWVEFPQKSDE